MTDRSHDITTSEGAEVASEQVKPKSKFNDGPGWEKRLFIRALLAQNLKDLLKSTGHTQSELLFYTGLAKQTVVTACNLDQDLSELSKSAFKSNTFVFTLCWYIDDILSTISVLKNNVLGYGPVFGPDPIVSKLVDRSSDKYAALSAFLQSEGLTLEQIEEYAAIISPLPRRDFSASSFVSFMSLWTESFKDFEGEITRELKGQLFKTDLLGSCGANSFDFTKARNVYFDLVFLQQVDLSSDIFMRLLLNCLIHNKIHCIFDTEQFYQLRLLMKKASWNNALLALNRCKDDLSKPNIDRDSIDRISYSANQQLLFIVLLSKLMRNLAILRKLELVPCRDMTDSESIDLLLSQKFAATDYSDQASQLIENILSGLNSFSKRRKIDLDSAYSFLDSLDRTKGNPYYIFTANVCCWPFKKINPTYDVSLRQYNQNSQYNDTSELFYNAKKNGLVKEKELHVMQYYLPDYYVYMDRPNELFSSLYLVTPENKVHPYSLFKGKLDTYYSERQEDVAKSFELDKSKGGATMLNRLHLDVSLQSFLDQLPDTYYGTVLLPNNGGSRHIETSAQKQQEHNSDWAAKLIVALDKILARGGFEG